MNYQNQYDLLMAKARSRREINGYFERHHVIPTSKGGLDRVLNKVKLTFREHYLAHLLLIKIYPDDVQMLKAMSTFASVKKLIHGLTMHQIHKAKALTSRGNTLAFELNPELRENASNMQREWAKNNPDQVAIQTEKRIAWMHENRELRSQIHKQVYVDKPHLRDLARQRANKQFSDPKQREIARQNAIKQWKNPVSREQASAISTARFATTESRQVHSERLLKIRGRRVWVKLDDGTELECLGTKKLQRHLGCKNISNKVLGFAKGYLSCHAPAFAGRRVIEARYLSKETE